MKQQLIKKMDADQRGKALTPRVQSEYNREANKQNKNRNRTSTDMKRLNQSLTKTIATLMLIAGSNQIQAQSGDLILDPNGSAGYFSFVLLGGAAYQSHSGTFTLNEEEIECCTFDGGTGSGPSIALRTEYTPDPEGRLRFAAGIRLSSETAQFLSEPEVLPVLGENHRPQDGLFQNELTVGTTSLDVSPMVMVKILDADLYVTFGGTWSRTLESTTDLRERILSPTGLTFLDGTTEKERSDLPVILVAEDRYSLTGGLDLRYPITERIRLATELHYTHGLSSYGQQKSWKARGVRAAIGIEFGIN